jgi:hypothetical protein
VPIHDNIIIGKENIKHSIVIASYNKGYVLLHSEGLARTITKEQIPVVIIGIPIIRRSFAFLLIDLNRGKLKVEALIINANNIQ